jgi:hypothetical protein
MVGLTRFLFLMNFCEKNASWANVYGRLIPFRKDGFFDRVKKLFVLQRFAGLPADNPQNE